MSTYNMPGNVLPNNNNIMVGIVIIYICKW